MSKEAISAAGARRWRYLVASLAALAVVTFGVTFFGNTETAKANATVTCGITAGNPPGAGTPNVNQTVYCDAVTALASTSVSWAVTPVGDAAAAANITNATAITTVNAAPSANFTFDTRQSLTPTGGGASYSVALTYNDANGPHQATESGQTISVTVNVVTGTVAAPTTNAAGMEHTATFSLPANVLCVSDPGDPAPPAAQNATARTCAVSDASFTLAGGATAVVDSVVVSGNRNAAGTVTVTFTGSNAGTVTPRLSVYNAATGTAGANQFAVSTSNTKTYALAELRHMSDDGSPAVITQQEINSNVRGSRHVVCTVAADTTTPVTIPLNALNQINVSSGGGYTAVGDPDPTFTDAQIFIGNGANGGLTGATCFSWVSTEAGDQEITVLYTGDDGNPYTVAWDSDNDNNGGAAVVNRSLVKEWNVLEDSEVTLSGGYAGKKAYTAPTEWVVEVPGVFNPATSSYLIDAITISDAFRGSHINRVGGKEGPMALAGVNWTVTHTGCGNLSGATSGTTYLNDSGVVAGGPSLTFDDGTGAKACTALNGATITMTGTEPGPLGSGAGNTVTQKLIIKIIEPVIPTKHIFLAWAGQRVILEHDWRLPGGDTEGVANGTDTIDDPDPLGYCPWDDDFEVQWIKGSGPGNFVAGLGVDIEGSDIAEVHVQGFDASQTDDVDVIGPDEYGESGANSSCISRVIYESEDQGQVDIEHFVDHVDDNGDEAHVTEIDNQTKVAFVIYYMKLNTVETSLVTSVSKPKHNATGADYSPGNPWDASTDVTDADWNVSKDLLVRVRVSGWFTNSNPSGRERDASDPTNVLPADRWVMPQDWAALQGGACGFDCRPEYDYMFAPNNTKGIALGNPEGTSDTLVTTTAAGSTTTSINVASSAGLTAGTSIKIGTTTTTVSAVVSGTNITVPALAAAPAAGTKVYIVGGRPFEGPLSALDIPGIGAGQGSAALSDWDPNNVRDTRLGDQVLDWWDAPMPPAIVTVDIRGAGFIKQVLKQDVYYLGTADATGQTYPNAYYIVDIPESPFLPAIVAGGGFPWDTWGLDGPGGSGDHVYRFWSAVRTGVNLNGVAGETLTAAQQTELAAIRTAYGDTTISRRLVVFSDNHGEAMVTANGDFKLTYDDCVTNVLAGGKHCSQDDVVGKSTISAIADYPDFRGKHFPVVSNTANVNWTWGGYKEVTIEPGEAEQFKYVVFHALDRDGFCATPTGVVSLHPVLSGHANDTFNGGPAETVDFLIDSDEGGIFIDGAMKGVIEVTKEFATMKTFDTAANTTLKEFDPINGSTSECQAWVKVSNSLLGRTNVLVIAHDDEGDIGFDKIVDFTDSVDYTLNFRWSLVTWFGADGISPSDALSGTGANEGGSDIKSQVTAVYGWQQDSQEWLAYFPGGEDVPGANDLTGLNLGDAYWIAIKGPSSITWTVVTDVN